MIVLCAVSWGMDGLVAARPDTAKAGEPQPASFAEVDAAMAPFAETLGRTLATSEWFTVDGAALHPLDTAPLTLAAHVLQGEPKLKPTSKAVAEKKGDRWNSVVLSNARVTRNADGSLAAMAFGLQSREQGRGVYVESKDVLVTWTNGRPSHVFTSATPDWDGWTERSLVTLTTDASGAITGATEQRARTDQEYRPDRDEPVQVTTASTVAWTR